MSTFPFQKGETTNAKLILAKTETEGTYLFIGQIEEIEPGNYIRKNVGICLYEKGALYIGYWKDDQYYGPGRLIDKNGTVKEGRFQNDAIELERFHQAHDSEQSSEDIKFIGEDDEPVLNQNRGEENSVKLTISSDPTVSSNTVIFTESSNNSKRQYSQLAYSYDIIKSENNGSSGNDSKEESKLNLFLHAKEGSTQE